ncbi:hypothetical protein QOT17_010069 [Balamuthia mandrillaris]
MARKYQQQQQQQRLSNFPSVAHSLLVSLLSSLFNVIGGLASEVQKRGRTEGVSVPPYTPLYTVLGLVAFFFCYLYWYFVLCVGAAAVVASLWAASGTSASATLRRMRRKEGGRQPSS